MKLTYDQEKRLTDELFRSLSGQWDVVLPRVIPNIQEAIKKGYRLHVTCILPGHGGKNDFRIAGSAKNPHLFAETGCVICSCTEKNPISSGLDLVMRVRNVDFMTAKKMLIEAINGDYLYDQQARQNQPPPVRPKEVDNDKLKRESDALKASIIRLWGETLPLTHVDAEPARLWFRNRSVTPVRLPISDVRFHPSMPCKVGEQYVGHFPTILSMLRGNDGRTKMLHRTFITSDGMKPEAITSLGVDNRMNYPKPYDIIVDGAAVRLDEPGVSLMVAEGLETALAARLLSGLPTWACMNAGLLKKVEIPACVRVIVVWADKDKSDTGQQAALELVQRARAEGRRAVALLPPKEIDHGKKGVDWNDMVLNQGVQAVRNEFQFRQWEKTMSGILAEYGDTSRVGLSQSIASTAACIA